MNTLVDRLFQASKDHGLDPLSDIDYSAAPDTNMSWMPDELLSLYGTPIFDELGAEQRRKLSQLEFSLVCSVTCFGEKEVIANLSRNLLKRRNDDVRKYLYFFIKEENDHILMFTEFCRRYGRLYPTLYSYAQGDLWTEPGLDLLMMYAHVFIFEEIGLTYNYELMRAESIPSLVRDINEYHWRDEMRHLVFGREMLKTLAHEVVPTLGEETKKRVHEHLAGYLGRLHYDFHNIKIYREIGIPEAFGLRDELVTRRNIHFFGRTPAAAKRVDRMLATLREADLLAPEPMDSSESSHAFGAVHG